MDTRKLLFSALSAFSCLSLVFSSTFQGLDADAAVISVELTPAETLALYGSSIPAYYCAYLNDYRETTFDYIGTFSNGFYKNSCNDENALGADTFDVLSSVPVANSYTYLVYACSDIPYGGGTSETVDFTFELRPSVSLGLTSLRTSLFFSYPDAILSKDLYMPSWEWMIDREPYTFGANYSSSGFLNYFFASKSAFNLIDGITFPYDVVCSGVPVYYESDTIFTASSSSVDVYRTSSMPMGGYEYYLLLLQCPIVSDGYTTGGSGSGGGGSFNPEIVIANGYFDVDGNIELEIDLSQIIELLDYIAHRDGYDQMDELVDAVNGVKDSVDDLKGSLADLIADAKESTKDAIDEGLSEGGPLSWIGSALSNLGQSILDGISSFFIPSDDAFQGFSDDISSSFDSHLGGISELGSLLDEQFRYIYDATSVDTIYLGKIHAPVEFDSNGNGVTYFDIGGYDVELKPEEEKLHVLYDALYYMIDLTAVFMVLNMLKTKRQVIYNPEGECISYDN